jgi:hypothetical protein
MFCFLLSFFNFAKKGYIPKGATHLSGETVPMDMFHNFPSVHCNKEGRGFGEMSYTVAVD